MIAKLSIILLSLGFANSNPTAFKQWLPSKPLVAPIRPPSHINSNSRIVGGHEVKPHSYPYQVALLVDGVFFCGGTLISDYWILTAAHCVQSATYVELTFGAHNIRDENEPTQIKVESRYIILHEQFNSRFLTNDIALINLLIPIEFNDNIYPIELSNYSPNVGTVLTATGWGKTQDGIFQGISGPLMEVKVPVISNEKCNSTFGYITEKHLCVDTLGPVGPQGICAGDSGGPLTLGWILHGITSHGANAGCEAGFPNVFTRITEYLDWIERHTGITPH